MRMKQRGKVRVERQMRKMRKGRRKTKDKECLGDVVDISFDGQPKLH